ncbi:PEP-CTERM sorting domain-containing protein [Kineobactrum salinum]|uniref:PEP-CTERM sorting domain-containing protein n=1 Tax=Kineobactrum salinum TaxID=2708301 RepID=A0A6C0U0Y6_9GAMM|nr:PEP-CTERM sorting domain-containing protein [Kineobactrum salinum]QIB65453.1 PEP-CTERM sorting domain-containing protein [Kineobactrum salinum]
MPSTFVRFFAVAGLTLFVSTAAQASLIVNGGFDAGLSGWTVDPASTTGVTWDSGTAHVGRPGPDGVAIFEQSFDIVAGTNSLFVGFDYQWQINRPSTPDFFLAELLYESTSGTEIETLVFEDSSSVAFNTTFDFSGIVQLAGLNAGPNNGTIRFTLTEDNSGAGSRIQLDNVAVNAVPLPATLLLVIVGLAGMTVRRKRFAAGK